MAAQYGAMVKRMHAGRAAQSGLYGALLAKDGFTGIMDVFEAPYGGFCTTFSRSRDLFDLNELSAGLGERFETLNVSLKFYSCVGSNHTTLDAIRDIRRRRPATRCASIFGCATGRSKAKRVKLRVAASSPSPARTKSSRNSQSSRARR